jgi:hypothetical protein
MRPSRGCAAHARRHDAGASRVIGRSGNGDDGTHRCARGLPWRSPSPPALRGRGAAAAPGVNETCLMCHGAADAKNAAGKTIAVDAAKFASSVHGEPSSMHRVPPTRPRRRSARGEARGQLRDRHEQPVKNTRRPSTAQGRQQVAHLRGLGHVILREGPGSRTSHANLDDAHAATATMRRLPGKLSAATSASPDSIHGKALWRRAGLGADVHEPPRRAQHLAERGRKWTNRARTCGSCHGPSAPYIGHAGSCAAKAGRAGCTDCLARTRSGTRRRPSRPRSSRSAAPATDYCHLP